MRRPQPRPTAHRLALLLALGAGLLGCGRQSSTETEANAGTEFVYDGGDYSWSSGADAGVTALTLAAGDNPLSAQPWAAATNGWGPVEVDASVGEKGAGDGRTLTLAGRTYARGLGTHANSSLTFDLNGQCRTFTADVGVDDEVGPRGSVVFQVYGDDEKLYDSGVMTGASATRSVQVDVSDRAELRLVATNGGDGLSHDHADWALPLLGGCTATPGAIRINAGGPAQTVGGTEWRGCTSVGACGGYVTGGFAYGEGDAVTGTLPPANAALYQTEWTGGVTNGVEAGEVAFAFDVPVPNGAYQVRLHFAELNKTAAGARVFDVNLEGGGAELEGLDIFEEAGGAGRALVRSVPVTVADGALNIAFVRRVENAKVSAIEILPLAPQGGAGDVGLAPAELVYSGVRGTVSAPRTLTVRNGGTGPLRVTGLTLAGEDAASFRLEAPALPLTLGAGGSVAVPLRFAPVNDLGSLRAEVRVETDDADEPTLTAGLSGLSARGLQGDQEPPLQAITQTLGYTVNVGGSALILGTGTEPLGDEVAAPLFRKLGSGPVTLRPVARYSPDDLLPFGYFTETGGTPTLNEVAVIARGQEQTLNPSVVSGGAGGFDPGTATFGLYVGRTSYAPQPNFTRDSLNTGPVRHATRIYPLRDRAGQPLTGQYLVAFEPAVNGDYQDYVFVVGNVVPVVPPVSWQERAGARVAVSEAQGAAVNGRLYIFGGFDKDLQTTARAQAYTLATNSWAAVQDMPQQITHGAVAADGGTIYMAGGFVGRHPGPQTANVWKYSVAQGTWSAGPPLPRAVGAGALVRLGRRLHFFGGTERDPSDTNIYRRDSPDHWVLNLDGGDTTWESLAPLPNPRNHLAGAVLNGRIYALGGQHLGDEDHGNQAAVHAYDPATNTWTERASLPREVGHINASTVAWGGQLVVVTGVAGHSAEIADVNAYDPAANRWTALTPLPAARQSPVAGVIDGQLVVSTGSLPSGVFATTWVGDR
ncbi:NPCBM/NEW2 domain-containing protein [Deinococcus sp. YIM 134068]|uniref:NPCBM/NEW2 domain-containing protein n=1 Tax=Deinococcus lichenicola TaxID=3118910 RepID=UPI002F9420E4